MIRNARLPAVRSLALLLAAAATAPLTAGAVPQEDGRAASPEARDEASRELNRLLTLSDGRVLRARSRQREGAWEVRGRDGWKALPPGAVERARLERDVLAEARRLERGVPREDTTKRVALADWLLRQGLAEEALEQLDRVLRVEPDSERVLALLAEPPQPLRIAQLATEDPELLLREAAGAPPAVRELAIRRLEEIEGEATQERLAATLHSHSPRLRTFAAVALRRLHPGEELRGLATRSLLDGSEQVRQEASLSLQAVGQEAVILPAVRALDSSSGPVRQNAIESLGIMGYAAAVPPLISHLASVSAPQGGGSGSRAPRANIFVGRQIAYIQDYDVEVAQGAAIADPVVNTLMEGSVLDVRVTGVHVFSTAVEVKRIRRSLALLTGEEHSAKGWLAWWEEHSGEFAPTEPETPARPETPGSRG